MIQCQGHPPFDWRPIDVGAVDDAVDDEAMGTKLKWWYVDPQSEDTPWLFKLATDKNGYVRGEDWAECLAHVVGQLVGVPTACVALGVQGGKRGVLIKKLPGSLAHGNELLAAAVPGYDTGRTRPNSAYSLTNIRLALRGYAGAHGVPGDAFDTFTGYLNLDAVIAGMDRHHENWAVDTGMRRMVPSFDHGNAFGYNLRDDQVDVLLSKPGKLERWVGHGKAKAFVGSPTLVELAADAMALASPAAAGHWCATLESISWTDLKEAVAHMPQDLLSATRGRLLEEMVELNRRRVLHAIRSR